MVQCRVECSELCQSYVKRLLFVNGIRERKGANRMLIFRALFRPSSPAESERIEEMRERFCSAGPMPDVDHVRGELRGRSVAMRQRVRVCGIYRKSTGRVLRNSCEGFADVCRVISSEEGELPDGARTVQTVQPATSARVFLSGRELRAVLYMRPPSVRLSLCLSV